MIDNILEFDLNRPAQLSSVPINSVDNSFSPDGVQDNTKEYGSGNNKFYKFFKKYLKPAPRNQLVIPTRDIYKGNIKKFYTPVIGNGNFIRGNRFAAPYPYKNGIKTFEKISNKTYQNPLPSNDNIDYNGSNQDVIMRTNSQFYPYPSQDYENNKNYKTYARENGYIKEQPIYNYPYGKIEGINEGEYNDILEPFATPGQMVNNTAFLGVIIIICSLSVILIYYKSKN